MIVKADKKLGKKVVLILRLFQVAKDCFEHSKLSADFSVNSKAGETLPNLFHVDTSQYILRRCIDTPYCVLKHQSCGLLGKIEDFDPFIRSLGV